ncbi:DUF3347 domain-containing protein [Pedobacter hiemivivus]|uniref:DUF3347 domain-containing protein n=1 Tax=Pedobacter hiemivivus TaxID=2530454 RepID=A0A4V5PD73_9SPHI|nr:DUF3347 domain-containing protein [Pedobacter hiemivivus]TKC63556.1 DUF3347 domain-containing protein [Pedobacter hiemivivus]
MKRIFLLVAILATSLVHYSFAQDHSGHTQTGDLLNLYYKTKDALVAGNANLVASKSAELVKSLTDDKTVSKAMKASLLEHAGLIAESKDLKSQREHFAGLSNGMITLVKSTKLSAEPIYQQYCPMKKANWLSSEKAIKNPYYGSSMLTCGKVVETIK